MKALASLFAMAACILITIFPGHSLANGLEEKLSRRGTINAFNSWQPNKGLNGYALYWDNKSVTSSSSITLITPNWNYYYPDRADKYPGIESFLTNRNWDHDQEYGRTLAIDLLKLGYIPYFVQLVGKLKGGSDGLLLDWWHDYHPNGLTQGQMKRFRLQLVKELRASYGRELVIMANVNWFQDKSTAPYLSGVYLELYKEPYDRAGTRLYTLSELRKIQALLDFYQKHLGYPKLIALQGWRRTKSLSDADRNSSENREMAKILTAMSAVIPENGYILYSDNNPDSPEGDHNHILYDFYDYDIGRPVAEAVKLSSTSRYREFANGLIVYNIGKKAVAFKFRGQDLTVGPARAAFCKFNVDGLDCS